jgi:hypothetical protein
VRLLALLTGCLCLSAGLGACGGGSSSSTSTSTPTTAQSQGKAGAAGGGGTASQSAGSAQQAAKPGGSSGSSEGEAGEAGSGGSSSGGGSQPTKTSASPSGSGHSGAAKKHAAGAAGFIAPTGDNSIPEYGSEASSPQQAEATAALRVYLVAREGGNWSGACANMGAPVRGQVEALARASQGKAVDCEEAFVTLSKYGSASERVNPLSGGLAAFRVKGDKAFALFYGPNSQQYMMPMIEEGGAWKVNQIAPVTYPPGAPPVGG